MRSSSVVLLFLLAVAMASRPSLAAARESGAGTTRTGITATLGRELRRLVARADSMFRSSSAGWHAASDSGAVAETKNLRAVAAARRQRPRKSESAGGGARCVTAAACRKRRVICGKRCYGASRGASSSVNHVARCVVKCKKCVPTC